MRTAIEGPQLTEVNFHQIIDIYKQQNHCMKPYLQFNRTLGIVKALKFLYIYVQFSYLLNKL